jgi:hypothetical protein
VFVAPPVSHTDATPSKDVVSESRALWTLLEPSRHEVETAVLHVQQNLRKPSRLRTRRRVLPLVAFVFVFGGALAYAAQGGVRDLFTEQNERPPVPAGVMAARARAVLGDRPIVPDSRTEVVGASRTTSQAAGHVLRGHVERQSEGQGKPNRPKAEQLLPSETTVAEVPSEARLTDEALGADEATAQASRARAWDTIGRALADGDTLLAERTLQLLMVSGHAPTVAKAELGLSQLSLAKGDCVAARRGALTLMEHPAASSAVRRGAERILRSCE